MPEPARGRGDHRGARPVRRPGDGRLHAPLRAGVHRRPRAAAPSSGQISYVRVHDIIGENRLIIDQTSTVFRPDDIPQAAIDEQVGAAGELVQEALGDVPEELQWTYRLLCGLGSHDLSAMRELLGRPTRVLRRTSGATAASSTRCSSTTDSSSPTRPASTTSCASTPHRGLRRDRRRCGSSTTRRTSGTSRPRSIIERTVGDAYERSVSRPHLKDPYTYELEYFHDMVVDRAARRRRVQRTTSRTWSSSSS